MTNQASDRPDSTDGSVPGRDAPLEAESGATTRGTGLGSLSRRRRRRAIMIALARTALSTTVLVVLYFYLPLRLVTEAASALLLAAGLVAVAVVLTLQIWATMRSAHPVLRAIESLGITAPLLLLLFSVAHYLLDQSVLDSYTEPLTRLDALYFSVTTFATVGYGDITPVTPLARVITMLQMFANLIFLGVVARVLFGVVADSRRSPAGQSSAR